MIKITRTYTLNGERNNAPRQPLVLDDRILVIFVYDKKEFTESNIQCLDRRDFSLLWEHRHNHVVNNLELLENGLVLASCMGGHVKCLDSRSGALLWEFSAGSNIGPISNVVYDRAVFSNVQTEDNASTWCIQASTGNMIWKQANPGHSYIPVIYGNRVFNCVKHEIHCLSLDDGSTIWTRARTEGVGNIVNPVIFRSHVLASGYGMIHFHEMASGEKTSVIKTGRNSWIRTVIQDGNDLYFGDESGFLYSFSVRDATPELNWEFDTQGKIASTPAIVGENILLINDAKRLFVFDKHSGALKESMKIKGTAGISGIVYKNGKFYFSCGLGHVYEVSLEE